MTDLIAARSGPVRPPDSPAISGTPAPGTPASGTPASGNPAQLDTGAGAATSRPSRGNRVRMLIAGAVATLVGALVWVLTLELVTSGLGVSRLQVLLTDKALLLMVSTLVVWPFILGLVALTGRLFLSLGLALVAAFLLGFASYLKLELRREPLYPSDFVFAGEPGFLSAMVSPSQLAAVLGVALLVVLVFVLLGRLAARAYPPVRRRTEPRLWRWSLLARVLVLVMLAGYVAYLGQFNTPGNKVRGALEASGAHWAFWFQKANYGRNGSVPGFLYNLNTPAMTEPEGYSAATMKQVSRRYAALAEQMNAGRSAAALRDVNIVVVLSEAFTDPTLVDGVTLEEDPIPTTRRVMSRTRSGSMLAQLFGGGTANMEFEALTGMSLGQFLPQLNTPYQQLVAGRESFPSAVGYLKGLGHRPVAIHPYMDSMYKRYDVYPTLGFTDFVHEAKLQSAERIDDNDFISDDTAFQEAVAQIEASEEPLLLNVVTMQNHFPMAGSYDDPLGVTGVSGETAEELSHYARGLRHSDDALRRFLDAVEASGEKTAVVFYGDHAPAFWPGEVRDAQGNDLSRRTPYFLWSNVTEHPQQPGDALVSPIYFLPTLFEDLQAPVPPYYALLSSLKREVSAMEQGELFAPGGDLIAEEDLSPRGRRLLRDYRLVQYDLAVGERYSQADLFYPG